MIKENDVQDIIVNMKTNEYIYSNAVLHPITKVNVNTYIIKENVPISLSIGNHEIDVNNIALEKFYYRNYKNKNIKIRCIDTYYKSGTEIKITPDVVYNVLKATNRLDGCLFILNLTYSVNENGKNQKKELEIPFKIVNEKEYGMYNEMIKTTVKADDGEIKKPKSNKN